MGGVLTRRYSEEIEHVYAYDLLANQDRSSEFRVGSNFVALDIERPGLSFADDDREAENVTTEIKSRIDRVIPIGLSRDVEQEKNRLVNDFSRQLETAAPIPLHSGK